MISQKAHSLLSELHKLLAGYESSDFNEAASFSPELRNALLLLSSRVGSKSPDPVNVQSSPSEQVVAKPTYSTIEIYKARRPSFAKLQTPEDVKLFLRKSGEVESAGQTIALAKRLNLPLKANEKDGKERLISRLSRSIASLPKERREAVARQFSQTPSSQTQGWIDVLKGSR